MSPSGHDDHGGRTVAPPAGAAAIVTGGSSGAGREVARRLAGEGFAIVVVYLADQSRAEAAVDEILAAAGTAVTVRADVTDDLDVERLFTESIAAFGAIDVLVHATSCSVAVLCRYAARHLRRGGAIVSGSSAERITPEIARQLSERGITVDEVRLDVDASGHGVADLIALRDRRPPPSPR